MSTIQADAKIQMKVLLKLPLRCDIFTLLSLSYDKTMI